MRRSADLRQTDQERTYRPLRKLSDAALLVSLQTSEALIESWLSATRRPRFWLGLLKRSRRSALARLDHLGSWTVSKSSPRFIQPLVFDQETCSPRSSTMQES